MEFMVKFKGKIGSSSKEHFFEFPISTFEFDHGLQFSLSNFCGSTLIHPLMCFPKYSLTNFAYQ